MAIDALRCLRRGDNRAPQPPSATGGGWNRLSIRHAPMHISGVVPLDGETIAAPIGRNRNIPEGVRETLLFAFVQKMRNRVGDGMIGEGGCCLVCCRDRDVPTSIVGGVKPSGVRPGLRRGIKFLSRGLLFGCGQPSDETIPPDFAVFVGNFFFIQRSLPSPFWNNGTRRPPVS